MNQGVDIFLKEELPVRNDSGSIINKDDELGLDHFSVDVEEGADEGVALPEFIGMSLGKGEPFFVVKFILVFKEIKIFCNPVERGLRNFIGPDQSFFNAGFIDESGLELFIVKKRAYGLNGLEQLFGTNLAQFTPIGATFVIELGKAVLFVAGIPRLDGFPGEPDRGVVFVIEGAFADKDNAMTERIPVGDVDGGKDHHFYISGNALHKALVVNQGPKYEEGR